MGKKKNEKNPVGRSKLEREIDKLLLNPMGEGETLASMSFGRGYCREIITHQRYGVVFYNSQEANWAETPWQKDHCASQVIKREDGHYVVGSSLDYNEVLRLSGISEFTVDAGRGNSEFKGMRIDDLFKHS